MTAQRQKEANVTLNWDNCWRSQREPEQSEVLSVPGCHDLSKKSLQTRGTREHQALHLLDPCSCTLRARGAFLRLLPLTEWAFVWVIWAAERKQGPSFPGSETATNPCGYPPVTNRNFKVCSLKHSEMAQIILEISDHSSLIFEFISQQTKAFLPHGLYFMPLGDSWR